jgi:hypothetical protein
MGLERTALVLGRGLVCANLPIGRGQGMGLGTKINIAGGAKRAFDVVAARGKGQESQCKDKNARVHRVNSVIQNIMSGIQAQV